MKTCLTFLKALIFLMDLQILKCFQHDFTSFEKCLCVNDTYYVGPLQWKWSKFIFIYKFKWFSDYKVCMYISQYMPLVCRVYQDFFITKLRHMWNKMSSNAKYYVTLNCITQTCTHAHTHIYEYKYIHLYNIIYS